MKNVPQSAGKAVTLLVVLMVVLFSVFMSCSDDDDDNDTDGTPTPDTSATASPTSSSETATPTPTPEFTPTPDQSIEGHWIGEVYLYEMIGPCQTIEFWVSGDQVSGTIYWTVGGGNPSLNKDCDEDANGSALTWVQQSFSADIIEERSFEWSEGSEIPPNGVIGTFTSFSSAFGAWYFHPEEELFNYGTWSAAKQQD